ncbi:GNAT family N-acetyltransferase [Salinibacterium sp. ZJ77]|uniref:GNAT family N-acetyltransferase n=1 Tax=Salinibacterium sp. ZJ77 TaxID=2708337 RepID=UPI00141F9262|nr:GNAT family N-acetyltransferase [Salinibacterium sp. ZJ77]
MTGFRIDEVPLPRDLTQDPHAADFVAMVAVRNACEEAAYGTTDVALSPERLLPAMSDPGAPTRVLLARVDGQVVGRALYETLADAPETAWIDTLVHPDARRRGIGRALADRVEQLAIDGGARQLIVYTPSPRADGARLVPPTGAGWVPADNPEVRFLRARGYRLEQVERASRLELPAHPDADWSPLPAAVAADGRALSPEYGIHVWQERTPPEWLDDIAMLITRMSTDAPQGALDEPEDVWDAARLTDVEQKRIDTGGETLLTTAAEHIASGRLVAFTVMFVPYDVSQPIAQGDTLVLREHRGHHLGMHIKLANVKAAARRFPGHPSVTTWNAEENRHMLAVNEALGFEPMGYEGAWKRTLA